MHRCFVEKDKWFEGEVEIDSKEAHHLFHVLRVRACEEIQVFDGTGRYAIALAPEKAHARGPVRLRLLGQPLMSDPPIARVTLLQAIPKAERMDWIIEKSVELGVTEVVPVLAERCVVRGGEHAMQKKRERWTRIAKEAAKQSGSIRIPAIVLPVDCKSALLAGRRNELFLVGALRAGLKPLGAVARDAAQRGLSSVALLIGPEGDLAPEELEAAIDAGAVPVTFGPHVLRVETAALFGLAVIFSEWLTATAGA